MDVWLRVDRHQLGEVRRKGRVGSEEAAADTAGRQSAEGHHDGGGLAVQGDGGEFAVAQDGAPVVVHAGALAVWEDAATEETVAVEMSVSDRTCRESMCYLQILGLAVSLGLVVLLEVASKASLDLVAVRPNVQELDNFNTLSGELQRQRLVGDCDGEIAVERHIITAVTSSVESDELGGRIEVEGLEVLADLGQVHADFLLGEVNGSVLLADLAADLDEAVEGAVSLARNGFAVCVDLGLLAAGFGL